ncbi:hypothetical protein [Nonomuraea sp. NPDC048826]|uniref:hypothetical protein n=1 Tax=Nonomuraea sp. NPDC048826 TaxID=3364347 RepID=UPI0037208FC0
MMMTKQEPTQPESVPALWRASVLAKSLGVIGLAVLGSYSVLQLVKANTPWAQIMPAAGPVLISIVLLAVMALREILGLSKYRVFCRVAQQGVFIRYERGPGGSEKLTALRLTHPEDLPLQEDLRRLEECGEAPDPPDHERVAAPLQNV